MKAIQAITPSTLSRNSACITDKGAPKRACSSSTRPNVSLAKASPTWRGRLFHRGRATGLAAQRILPTRQHPGGCGTRPRPCAGAAQAAPTRRQRGILASSRRSRRQTVANYIQRYGAHTEKQAHQFYRFISNPLFRSYVFNYHHGRELLNRYTAGGDRIARFRTLLEQPITPSRVEERIKSTRQGASMKTIRWGMIGCGNVTEVKSGLAFKRRPN